MNRKGFAGLVVLIAVAIAMILAMMQMRAIFKPLPEPKHPVIDNERPWLVEDDYLDKNGIVELPTEPKTLLIDTVRFDAQVERKGNPRGVCSIEIDTSGMVTGKWDCTYQYDEKQYSYSANFDGNVVADHTYEDKDGKKDETKLFFFTKGRYVKTIANQSSGSEFEEEGDVYVTGWLNTDLSAFGKVTITSNRESSSVYEFKSERNDE